MSKKMSLKKITLIVSAVALVAIIAVGGTLAWFTDSKDVVNTVTYGDVKIDLQEPNYDPEDAKNITPGEEITKDPTITNTGVNDAYFRAKLVIGGDLIGTETTDAEGNKHIITEEDIIACLNIGSDWTRVGDYFYFNEVRANGEEAVLFTKVTLPNYWDGKIAGKTLTIEVKAEAIQSDNFTPKADGSWDINENLIKPAE
ncbi:TasA family protein [Candidatus Soleaferrea massiliensis]|uniref:TasA family protein n=1 Tax=Candidatus Soleaferrea massiliensis TaxID=1470354 RepID=UPI000693B7E2|nr:TasA family protein [Candidatus Soleaferrea massiliensis]